VTSTSAPDHYAIVVGIDRYPALTDLRGACNDADAFHRWLSAPEGGAVPAAQTRLHLGREAVDARTAAPKKWEIDADLGDLVEAVRARPPTAGRSRLYLYFAGHGIAAGGGSAAWLMADAKHNMFTNLALGPYQAWLDRCRDFDEVVIVSDCCRSIMTKVPEAPQPYTPCDEPARNEQRVFLVHAADVGHRAFEIRTAGEDARGHLTRALLEGLGGAATEPGTAEVRATGLAAHLRERVRALSQGRQRVQITFDDRMVVIAGAATLHSVRIKLCDHPQPRPVRVLGAAGIVASGERIGGPWELRLPDGDYELIDSASDTLVRFAVAGAPIVVQGSACRD
jgi:hypothetical protein